MAPGSYQLERFCMEPVAFNVKVPGSNEYKKSTLMTRLTYLLSEASARAGAALVARRVVRAGATWCRRGGAALGCAGTSCVAPLRVRVPQAVSPPHSPHVASRTRPLHAASRPHPVHQRQIQLQHPHAGTHARTHSL